MSWQSASQLIALIAGSLVGVILTAVLPQAALETYGWRLAFLLGAAVVPFGLWLRARLPETLPLQSDLPSIPQSRGQAAFEHRRVLLLAILVLGSATIANYIGVYMVTYTQDTLHMAARVGFIAATAGYVIAIPATLLGGWLSDKVGRCPVNVWGNLASLLFTYAIFAWITTARSSIVLITGVMILSALQNFWTGSYLAGLSESLPPSIRSSGFGFSYSFAIAAFGGTTQLIVTWLIHLTGNPMAPAWYLIGALVIGQIALMLVPESAPAKLAGALRAILLPVVPTQEDPADLLPRL